MGLFWNQSEQTEISNEAFSIGNIDNINIEAGQTSASVNIFYTEETKFKAILKSTYPDNTLPFESSVAGNSITIKLKQKTFIGIIANWHITLDIYVPEIYLNNLKVGTASGSIKCEEILILRNIVLASASGSIKVNDLISEKNIELSSASGSINANNSKAKEKFKANCASGSIKLENINAANVDLGTASGSINLTEVTSLGNLTAKSASGSIKADYIEAKKAECSTASGSIKIGRASGEFEMSSASGGINVSEIRGCGKFAATSGSVKIDFEEINGDIDARSSSGSVNIGINESVSLKCTFSTTSGSFHYSGINATSINKRKYEAVLGSGEHTLTASTTSGSLKITAD